MLFTPVSLEMETLWEHGEGAQWEHSWKYTNCHIKHTPTSGETQPIIGSPKASPQDVYTSTEMKTLFPEEQCRLLQYMKAVEPRKPQNKSVR